MADTPTARKRAHILSEVAAQYFDHADDEEFVKNFTKDAEAAITAAVEARETKLREALETMQQDVCARWCDEADPETPHCEECIEATAALATQEAGDG